jgi:hypothetical protein
MAAITLVEPAALAAQVVVFAFLAAQVVSAGARW